MVILDIKTYSSSLFTNKYIYIIYIIYQITTQLNNPFLLLLYSFPAVSNKEHDFLSNFLEKVCLIYHSKSSLHNHGSDKLLFRFECTKEAAIHNANVLQCYNFDLNSALHAQKNSQVFYGTKFRPVQDLAMIFNSHPLWKHTSSILSSGATYPLHHIPTEIRNDDIAYHKERGNHKSALKISEKISTMIQEDVDRGFTLPLPIEILPYLPNASLAPLGCQEQSTINALGERVKKFRLTHDQSFPGPSGSSVNLRIDHSKLPPIMYGFCLRRIIHYILGLRQRHPETKIMINKFDYDAAYRCCHMASTSATESLTIHNKLLFMALRLTFGGSTCPNLWNCISESGTDLANMLIQNSFWDHTSFYDPLSSTIDKPNTLPPEIPFAKTKDLAVKIPINDIGKADIYIDDTIGVALDLNDNVNRVSTAIPLAIHTMARPLDPLDDIPRKEIISLKKFSAEGQPSETKTVLGWFINTRTLTISLPLDKYNAWSQDINNIISTGRVSKSSMETLIGRLNHVAYLMDMLRHFMSRLRMALQRTQKHRFTYLKTCEKADLGLMLHFLHKATLKGVSLNNLSYRKATHIFRSDASLHGIGGYNIISGKAWRFQLPINCRLRTSLNSLEFIAALVTIWMNYLHGDITSESCILSQTDSTSATGWLKKSNFTDANNQIVQLTTARKIAYIILDLDSCLYS
jgi:hypothetical protein